MTNHWSLEEFPQGKVRPAPLFEDLQALARRWQSQPSGNRLSSGLFESQADAEDLLARLNAIRRPDDPEQVLQAAQQLAQLGRVMRQQDLDRVLLPYAQVPPSSPFHMR